jgi:hypothetical protein
MYSSEGMEAPTLLGPLERANLKYWAANLEFQTMYRRAVIRLTNNGSPVEMQPYGE